MIELNGTSIVLAISFVIFVILLNFLFYKPMKRVMEERTKYTANILPFYLGELLNPETLQDDIGPIHPKTMNEFTTFYTTKLR